MKKQSFTQILHRVKDYAAGMGVIVIDSKTLNPYFKGDLDGTRIWINFDMDDEEELFNVLHMIGHAVQWGLDPVLKELGSKLHANPDEQLLKRLLEYEWEANCYGLAVLHDLGIFDLDQWLEDCYEKDLFLLTHFYKTGEKVKYSYVVPTSSRNVAIEAMKQLIAKPIPKTFIPTTIEGSRDGIVIDFTP